MQKTAMREAHYGLGINHITRSISAFADLSDFCAAATGEILE